MNPTTPQVDGYIRKNKRWAVELQALRQLLLDAGLTETIKWRAPCYTFKGANVIIIGAAKDHCVLSFLKGALLKDPHSLLQPPGPNSQSARVIRFTTLDEITTLEPALKSLIQQAIKTEQAGLKVTLKKITDYPIPPELQAKFDESPSLQTAFQSLTPGRQRAYLMHFSAPKQSETRTSRIERCTPKILAGQGLDDDYKARIKKASKKSPSK